MNEDKKLGSLYELSTWEMQGSPLQPSELLRQREARMIGRMAEEAHLAGRQFVEWPTFTMTTDVGTFSPRGVVIRAEVIARKVS